MILVKKCKYAMVGQHPMDSQCSVVLVLYFLALFFRSSVRGSLVTQTRPMCFLLRALISAVVKGTEEIMVKTDFENI